MEKRTREHVIDVLRPGFVVLRFLWKIADKAVFGWFGLWSQRKDNALLERDIQAELNFLYSEGQVVKESWNTVHPFDYASVRINYKNICFCVTRGQGQLNISLSPRH